MSAYDKFIGFWKKAPLHGPPYVHPDDFLPLNNERLLDEQINSFPNLLSSRRYGDTKFLHTGLLPLPYIGDLKNAEIVILQLNARVWSSDYREQFLSNFKQAVRQNTRQELSDCNYPFLWLDPEFYWHSGFSWWTEGQLRPILNRAMLAYGVSLLDTMKSLSKRIAHIELSPYRSASFGTSDKLLDKLPSTINARRFVSDWLLPRAMRKEVTVYLSFGEKRWNIVFPELVIRSNQTRKVNLGRIKDQLINACRP